MTGSDLLGQAVLALHIGAQLALIGRVILRPHRDPSSRVAWVVVIAVTPLLGILLYLLFGEVNIGRRRAARVRRTLSNMPSPDDGDSSGPAAIPDRYAHLFHIARSITGFLPVGGNRGRLLADSNSAIDAMVADIGTAQAHVHVLFYIWLADHNGLRMIEALAAAAARGVACRVMADDLGSRALIRSPHWERLRGAGVRVAVALPIGNPLLRLLRGRIDVRNHRKIVVIDGRITYCGSQNCADPEFRVKPRFAPWVDAVMRFEGPVARQNQYLFACDWMNTVDEDIRDLLGEVEGRAEPGFPAQVIGTGPTVRYSAMPEVFESLMFAARHELLVSTPYYVPNDSMQTALCAAAYRGVATTLIVPARNDSWVVSAASRSYYDALLAAGVRIVEYEGGLLHVKSLTIDGEVTLIGSANLDRRSFEINFENNILFYDPALTADMRARQESYVARARLVSLAEVRAWPVRRRLWNNTIAMLGPLL